MTIVIITVTTDNNFSAPSGLRNAFNPTGHAADPVPFHKDFAHHAMSTLDTATLNK